MEECMRSPRNDNRWQKVLQQFYLSTTLHICLLFCCLLTACDSSPSNTPVTRPVTPTPAVAAGEPVLAHSQIFFHNAPLPAQTDLRFDDGDWTLSGRDNAATRSVDLPSCCSTQPAARWFHSIGVPLLDAPIVGNGHIYLVASDGFLHVLRTEDGEEQWRIPVGGEMVASGLALAHGMIYLTLSGHFIAALNANNGQVRWRFNTVGLVRATPMVIGREVLVASGANTLFCLDAFTGEQYWAFHSEDTLTEFWPTNTTPVVSNGLVYVALGAANEFNALSLQTGRKVWEVALGERMTGGPMLDEKSGLVYVVTWSGRVVALDMHSGSIRWNFAFPGGSQSSPALSPQLGMLYVGGYDGSIYALDANTGQLQWRTEAGSAITAAPLVVQEATQSRVIVAAQQGKCLLLDARTGKLLQTWQLGELRAAPIIARGVLYQASLGDQGLFAFSL